MNDTLSDAPEHTPAPSENRLAAERDARHDLLKSDLQVLADVHEELLRSDRPVGENLVHANKRIASIMVRTAMSNDRASRRLIVLTMFIAVLTFVLVVLTFFLWWEAR